ncbi:MAG: DUF115 domain-containing protein [Methanobacteriota archaeon]|nr:MAG: DUF115 domain-containing protein [Euryarchaeota archaeon]
MLCGCGGSLEPELEFVGQEELLVAADGATSTLVSASMSPDIIVTDLDGKVEDQVEANAEGSVVFVHAHGDNRGAIERYAPAFEGALVGTCQCAPVSGLFNFGGFTDGDRAACILSELGVSHIRLAGFDFETPSEKSGRSSEAKARKLAWARRILGGLSRHGVRIEQVVDGSRAVPNR